MPHANSISLVSTPFFGFYFTEVSEILPEWMTPSTEQENT